MNKIIYTICFFCFFTSFTSSQNSQLSFQKKLKLARDASPNYEIQIKGLKEVLKELEKTNFYDTLGFAHYFIAYRYSDKLFNQEENAILNSKQALDYFEKSSHRGFRKQRVVDYLIKNLNKKARFSEAIAAYNTYSSSYDVDESTIRTESLVVKNTSKSYREIGELDAGLTLINNHFKTPKENKIKPRERADLLLEKSFLEYDAKNYKDALVSIEQALYYEDLYNKQSDLDRLVNFINQNALVYSKLEKKDEAAKLYNLYLTKDLTMPNKFILLNNAYDNFYSDNNFKIAHTFAKKAFEISKMLTNKSEYQITALNNLSESFRQISKIDSAIYIGKIAEETLRGIAKNTFINPQQPISVWYQQLLNYEAKYLYRENKEDVDLAHFYINKIDSLVPELLSRILFEGSMLQNKLEIATWYDAGVRVAYNKKSPELFIKYSDRTKSLSFQKLDALESEDLKITESIEIKLKELVRVESEINMKIALEKDNTITDSLSAEELLNREEQRKLLTQLKSQSPPIRPSFNYDFSMLSDKDLSIIYYHKTDSVLYACHLKPGFEELIKIDNTTELYTILNNYITNIKSNTFQNTESRYLFNHLVKPFKNLSEKLVFIPDQELSLLPFETLLNDDDTYLIENYEISYALSYKHFIEMNNISQDPIATMTIVSPDYDQNYNSTIASTKGLVSLNDQFSFLEHTKDEVAFLSDHFDASTIAGLDITKDQFFDAFQESTIFHFTGHAVSILGNDDLSFLALGASGKNVEQDVFIREISEQETDASLVFLNACNTGAGSILKGEGVYNLARSFFKSGANSVISGLWEIDDYTSSQITKSFYSYLKSGETKSKALQLAKLDYIKNVKLDSKRDPYYWSGLILTGNTNPIFTKRKSTYYILGVLCLFLGGLAFKKIIKAA